MLRFARSRPTQATAVDDLTVQVAVVRGGRVGSASTNGLTARRWPLAAAPPLPPPRRPRAAVARAPTPASPPEPRRGTLRPHDGYDPATARIDPGPGGAALAAAFEACAAHGVEAHGTWTVGETRTAVASTAGAAASDRLTDAFMKVTAIAPGGRSGYAEATAVAATGIDAAALAQRAAAKAARPGAVASLPPGEYPVVFEADAVGDLLHWYGALAANGLAYAEERSALCERLGTRVCAARINLADSPRFAAHPAARLRRRGGREGSAAADPGRRGPQGGARHSQRRACRGPDRRATRRFRAATPGAPPPPTSC